MIRYNGSSVTIQSSLLFIFYGFNGGNFCAAKCDFVSNALWSCSMCDFENDSIVVTSLKMLSNKPFNSLAAEILAK